MLNINNLRYLFIINPKAGKGQFRVLIPHIKNEFPSDIQYDITISQFPGEARNFIQKRMDEYDVFVAAGGDGTVNEVSGELINTGKHLGLVAIGSGNGLAREMGIPLNYHRALRVLQTAKTKVIDAVNINSRSFINMAGVGFDGTIARRFEGFGKRGIWPYMKIVPQAIISYKPREYEIVIDGKSIWRTAFMISLANTTQFGAGAHICPPARPDDGIIHIVVLKPFKYNHIPGMAYYLFTRQIDRSKAIEIFSGKEVIIRGKDLCAHIDGEPVELGDELKASIIPASVSVIC